MRPVDKGDSPYEKIDKYQDALPYLEEKIGLYCSYCEMPIKHVPEVEHVVSKSKGGDLTAWENLNLGCKYCNSRKSFSVWMTVFSDEPQILLALIDRFPGTRRECYDEQGRVVPNSFRKES